MLINLRPPDPLVVGERWREMWLERLEHLPLFIKTWLEHQQRDDYWKHGSICEDYSSIEAATLAVGGWCDAYSNTVFRLIENIKAPVRGLVGPWADFRILLFLNRKLDFCKKLCAGGINGLKA